MNEPTRKRRRKNEDGSTQKKKKKKELKGIFSSLLFLDAQKKREEEEQEQEQEQEQEKLLSVENNKKKGILEYYSNVDGYYSEVEESNRKKRKKLAGGESAGNHHRRLWVKDRSGAWWDECSKPDFPEEEFRKAFRMGRMTFEAICEDLNSVIAKEDTTLRNAIPVKQRVAVCLWRLATGDPLRVVSKRFGLGISTCHKLVLEVCTAIKTVLMPKYLQWPNGVALRNIKGEFESISGIPNVVGSMYTSHVPIIAPKISVSAYFNKRHTEKNHKTCYSVTVQGVVDHRGVFTDVCIGWPGSMGDDQVLEKSALFQRANSGGILNGMWVVGGSGYPLLDWVLVPYTQQNLTWTQHAFNEKIGEVHRVAKDAFGRLKGRWCCLQKRTEVKLQDLPVVLGACCVLHNICELKNEEMDPELLKVDVDGGVDDDHMVVPEAGLRSVSSMKARDSIAHNLLHHGLAGTSFV
ncbi:hypothetical protein RJT34_10467 [Clitoria ternatea]|uniref:DDE Tnp4 domain-containing protein n=1 Tax=Clitoria ternatea TaxID=43366 RepID=A0AAN9K837_CLITE